MGYFYRRSYDSTFDFCSNDQPNAHRCRSAITRPSKSGRERLLWAVGRPVTGNFGYSQKYLTMPPQAILAETPGNFALDNNSISRINVHLKGAHHEHNQRREFELKFYSNTGTYEFHMDENSEFIDTLKADLWSTRRHALWLLRKIHKHQNIT